MNLVQIDLNKQIQTSLVYFFRSSEKNLNLADPSPSSNRFRSFDGQRYFFIGLFLCFIEKWHH
jgi:hypothetical protein